MKFPVIVVNFKAYKESTGRRSLKLAAIAERISRERDANIIIAPNNADISLIVEKVNIPVFAQHVDPVGYGAYTGHISPQHLKDLGIRGTILNHSEKKLSKKVLTATLKLVDEAGLESVVCVDSLNEFKELLSLNLPATCFAIEPPELIGSGKAVSKHKPKLLVEAVRLAEENGYPLLCGAGIVTGEDVKKAIELGTKGILVASGVVKAKNPEKILEEFWLNSKL